MEINLKFNLKILFLEKNVIMMKRKNKQFSSLVIFNKLRIEQKKKNKNILYIYILLIYYIVYNIIYIYIKQQISSRFVKFSSKNLFSLQRQQRKQKKGAKGESRESNHDTRIRGERVESLSVWKRSSLDFLSGPIIKTDRGPRKGLMRDRNF